MKSVFTTTEIAKLLNVAPRQVNRWFDSGRLRGYRIPGVVAEGRRVPRQYLVRFLKDEGIPVPEGLEDPPS